MTYEILTACGDFYITDEKGNVLQRGRGGERMMGFKPDGTWIITGVWWHGPWGHIQRMPLAEAADRDDYKLKNGKPRYGATDIDHGTHRLWGNKDYHGVRYIRACN
jgi:hypothetical protein